MLQPVVRRTWAPQGHTPIHYSWDRRDRLSVISAISLSPHRRRLGLYFGFHDHNLVTEDVVPFVARVLAHLPKGIILIMDRWQVHRSAARRLQERFPRRVDVEWLPPYAPDLNPVEQVWSRTKYGDLANYLPDNAGELGRSVRRSLRRTRRYPSLLRSFFKHVELKM
jgi:transposase